MINPAPLFGVVCIREQRRQQATYLQISALIYSQLLKQEGSKCLRKPGRLPSARRHRADHCCGLQMRRNANGRITTIVRDADCTRFDAHSSMSDIGFGYARFLAPFSFFLQLPGEPFGIKTGARDKKRSQDDQGRQRGAKRASNQRCRQ
jgi:hypothetical protein